MTIQKFDDCFNNLVYFFVYFITLFNLISFTNYSNSLLMSSVSDLKRGLTKKYPKLAIAYSTFVIFTQGALLLGVWSALSRFTTLPLET